MCDGWITCNVDGSVVLGNSANCAGIFRYSEGEWLLGFARNIGSGSFFWPNSGESFWKLLGLKASRDRCRMCFTGCCRYDFTRLW